MKSIILEEWKELRAEITRKQSFAEHILVAAGAANFAILAYGLKDCAVEGVAVCILPTVVTSVVYLWLLTYIFSGFRIASYIKNELEPKIPGFHWRTGSQPMPINSSFESEINIHCWRRLSTASP